MSFFDALGDAAEYVGGGFTAAPSERDLFQSILGTTGELLAKRTQEHYLSAKATPPAQISGTLSQTGAAANPFSGGMSPTVKAGLIVGGIILTVVVMTIGLSMLGRKGK